MFILILFLYFTLIHPFITFHSSSDYLSLYFSSLPSSPYPVSFIPTLFLYSTHTLPPHTLIHPYTVFPFIPQLISYCCSFSFSSFPSRHPVLFITISFLYSSLPPNILIHLYIPFNSTFDYLLLFFCFSLFPILCP